MNVYDFLNRADLDITMLPRPYINGSVMREKIQNLFFHVAVHADSLSHGTLGLEYITLSTACKVAHMNLSVDHMAYERADGDMKRIFEQCKFILFTVNRYYYINLYMN